MTSKIKYLLIAMSLTMLVACDKGKEVITSRYPDGTTRSVEFRKEKDGREMVVKEVRFYPSGQMMEEVELENGNRNGKFTQWYVNGEKSLVEYYTDGIKNGKSINYYDNGKINFEAEYTNGIPSGTWVFYDKSGSMLSEKSF